MLVNLLAMLIQFAFWMIPLEDEIITIPILPVTSFYVLYFCLRDSSGKVLCGGQLKMWNINMLMSSV